LLHLKGIQKILIDKRAYIYQEGTKQKERKKALAVSSWLWYFCGFCQ